jgi:hypothetical protein
MSTNKIKSRMTEQELREYVAGIWGFQANRVELLEVDPIYPNEYIMFEVCGVQYQAFNEELTIYDQPKRGQ